MEQWHPTRIGLPEYGKSPVFREAGKVALTFFGYTRWPFMVYLMPMTIEWGPVRCST